MLNTIGSIISSAFQWFSDFIVGLIDSCYAFFLGENGLLWWFVNLSLDLFYYGISLFDSFSLGSLLSQYSSESQLFFSIIVFCDLFFPVHELLTLIEFFISFVVIFISVKFIVKAIPTVG
jgi:hypothetical protein